MKIEKIELYQLDLPYAGRRLQALGRTRVP